MKWLPWLKCNQVPPVSVPSVFAGEHSSPRKMSPEHWCAGCVSQFITQVPNKPSRISHISPNYDTLLLYEIQMGPNIKCGNLFLTDYGRRNAEGLPHSFYMEYLVRFTFFLLFFFTLRTFPCLCLCLCLLPFLYFPFAVHLPFALLWLALPQKSILYITRW